MTEFFQFLSVLLLFLIWYRLGRMVQGEHARYANDKLIEIEKHLEEIGEQMKTIGERLADNFMTDKERQARVDREP